MNTHCHLLEPEDVPVGRLVVPGDSEGLIEGLVLVAGTSMLSSVTAGWFRLAVPITYTNMDDVVKVTYVCYRFCSNRTAGTNHGNPCRLVLTTSAESNRVSTTVNI